MKLEEELIEKNYVYNGRIINVRNDSVALPNGRTAQREVVEHNGGAGILAVDEEGYTYLVRQFRYPFGTTMLEIPAGKIDKGESPLATATRELTEETGFIADSIAPLGEVYPTVGYSSEIIYIYLATGLHKGIASPDADEFLQVLRLPIDEAYHLVMNGEIKDSKTVVAILKYFMAKNNDNELSAYR